MNKSMKSKQTPFLCWALKMGRGSICLLFWWHRSKYFCISCQMAAGWRAAGVGSVLTILYYPLSVSEKGQNLKLNTGDVWNFTHWDEFSVPLQLSLKAMLSNKICQGAESVDGVLNMQLFFTLLGMDRSLHNSCLTLSEKCQMRHEFAHEEWTAVPTI